ncbi:heat shock protein DnaJ domain protein [Parafrankia sp. EAN1pec]|uniref:DnaJ domain-containing protein n=1 Tax=Parafrankia sp. (strain EAN1pec) TaxID=298653 RepID=UPI0000542A1C|nr:heat shock protein DnaJ domain protein [Frankia sp. EAN1pec]
MDEGSLYEVLGIVRTATDAEIRAAYRRAAKHAHPDAGGSPRSFQRVHAAYRVLGDPARRHAYDLGVARSAEARARPGASPSTPSTPADAGGRAGGVSRPVSRADGGVPHPDARERRRYLIAMAVCLLLFVLAGTVVRLFSVPAALGMMILAMVIPPAAVISVSRPPPHR